jgi:hypothetical protein
LLWEGFKGSSLPAGRQGFKEFLIAECRMRNVELKIRNPQSEFRIPENPGILESFPHGR